MPYRPGYCHCCKNERSHSDTSSHEYGYSARSTTRCVFCWIPEAETPRKSDDDLVAEATERMIAARGITKDEYYAERAEEMGWRV
ncbi:MAG: hypothetical protein ING26_03205 [Roseomonas sp.]|nr:hypothetical protein [Roseomonas sp.]